jgi:hypothetical protein
VSWSGGFDLSRPKEGRIVAKQLQFRAEVFNLTNTPHFANPPDAGRNVSNMTLNADGTIRSLGGYTVLNATKGTGREGVDERVFRFGMRLSF